MFTEINFGIEITRNTGKFGKHPSKCYESSEVNLMKFTPKKPIHWTPDGSDTELVYSTVWLSKNAAEEFLKRKAKDDKFDVPSDLFTFMGGLNEPDEDSDEKTPEPVLLVTLNAFEEV